MSPGLGCSSRQQCMALRHWQMTVTCIQKRPVKPLRLISSPLACFPSAIADVSNGRRLLCKCTPRFECVAAPSCEKWMDRSMHEVPSTIFQPRIVWSVAALGACVDMHKHWRRQLWGTGARAPIDLQQFISFSILWPIQSLTALMSTFAWCEHPVIFVPLAPNPGDATMHKITVELTRFVCTVYQLQ